MKSATPMELIRVVNRSIRCFVFRLLSFIPVLGLPMVVIAWIQGHIVLCRRGREWNAAQHYLRWGRVLALVGAFASSVLFGLILAGIVKGAVSFSNYSRHT